MAVNIIGQSGVMLEVLNNACQLAATNYSIIIQGETGTGKELLAHYIHENSPRSGSAFIPVNIASYNSNLIDSELFGHVKGAFTGAVSARMGVFERAGDGTVLLDEIGDLPLDLQVKLLRVLEAREFQRVGGNDVIPMKARVLAATNVDLVKSIKEGRFREDLFFRFGLKLWVPPLRERREDIVLLAEHIINDEKKNLGRDYPDWFNEACRLNLARLLTDHPCQWPGNVRELRTVLKALLVEVVNVSTQEDFEQRAEIVLERQCSSGGGACEGDLLRLISELVRENIFTYPLHETSLRSRINDILVNGISEGLGLAVYVDNFKPGSRKEIGEILGIPSLVSANRPGLPSSENDYIVRALRNLDYREELPEKLKEVMKM